MWKLLEHGLGERPSAISFEPTKGAGYPIIQTG